MEVLVPMTQPEFLAYMEESAPSYAEDKVASGQKLGYTTTNINMFKAL